MKNKTCNDLKCIMYPLYYGQYKNHQIVCIDHMKLLFLSAYKSYFISNICSSRAEKNALVCGCVHYVKGGRSDCFQIGGEIHSQLCNHEHSCLI